MGMKLLVLSTLVVVALSNPDADADAHYGGYGYRRYGYGYPYAYGYGRGFYGKRSAEAEAAYGKRSAEPHGVVGHVHGLGVAGHPGHATSYVGRTIYGYPSAYGYGRRYFGKRSAEPAAGPHYGGYGYAYGVPGGYTHVS